MESVPTATGEAHEQPALVSDPAPPAREKAPAALSAPVSSYQASRAQAALMFPLSGPPVLVSFQWPGLKGMLRSRHDDATGVNLIQLTDEFHQKRTQAQKFYLEPSKLHPSLLHIRSADGDKYLVAQQLANGLFVTATADKPEEDLTMPSCTLFNIHNVGDGFSRIQHKDTMKYVCMFSLSGQDKLYMQIGDENPTRENEFRILHLSDQQELPKYIHIKGDNDKYLKPQVPLYSGVVINCFAGDDNNDETLIYETFTDDFGLVRLRHYTTGTVCVNLPLIFEENVLCTSQLSHNEIDTNISEDTLYEDVGSLFKVIIKEGNSTALQCVINDKFLNMISYYALPQYKCLRDNAVNSYPKETSLQIEQPVRSREIFDVQYHEGVTKSSEVQKATRQEVLATNRTHQVDRVENSVQMMVRTESKWDAHLSLDVGIKATMKVDFPLLADFDVESHADFHGEYNWGNTEESKITTGTKVAYDVPPMTTVSCDIFSKVLKMDVPFSYKVRDTLFNGKVTPPRQMHDGLYRGVLTNDVHIETKEEKIE